MIGKLTGILDYKGIDHVLIDVHGVGYEVFLAESTLAKAPSRGNKISVHTELIVREDLLQLVGFATRHEREWYRLLIGVQGVGSKAALKILGTLQTTVLSRSILTGDANAIKAAQGIGPKIAQRIVTELKDKAPTLMALSSQLVSSKKNVETGRLFEAESNVMYTDHEDNKETKFAESSEASDGVLSEVQAEALSALTNLGYSSFDAAVAISNVSNETNRSFEVKELIKLALQNLVPKA